MRSLRQQATCVSAALGFGGVYLAIWAAVWLVQGGIDLAVALHDPWPAAIGEQLVDVASLAQLPAAGVLVAAVVRRRWRPAAFGLLAALQGLRVIGYVLVTIASERPELGAKAAMLSVGATAVHLLAARWPEPVDVFPVEADPCRAG